MYVCLTTGINVSCNNPRLDCVRKEIDVFGFCFVQEKSGMPR